VREGSGAECAVKGEWCSLLVEHPRQSVVADIPIVMCFFRSGTAKSN
jgi:hypothetical protein